MLKKKLVRQEETRKPILKNKPTRRVEPEDEEDLTEAEADVEDEQSDEDVEEETPLEKRKRLRAEAAAAEEDSEDEEEAPARTPKKAKILGRAREDDARASKKSALTRAFSKVPLSNNATDIPKADYYAVISELVLQPFEDGKGQFVRIKYELCEEELAGRTVPQWWKILDANEEPIEFPFQMMLEALGKLGYQPKTDRDLEQVCQEVTDEKPGVLIRISYTKDNDGNDRQRAVLQGPADDDVIQEYKDSVPY